MSELARSRKVPIRRHVGRARVCLRCLGLDPERAEWSGWRGDCPYLLGTGTCSYGDCASPNIAEPQCMTCIPDEGWGEDPGGVPCWECDGTGAVPAIDVEWVEP